VGRQDAHPAATVRRRTQGNGPVLLPDHARPIRYQDWGVTYTTAAQFSSTLNRCYFHFSIDISDAYHLSLWAGCGGELRPVQRPVIVSNGPGQPSEVSWVDANDCTPST
jgi:hypothetical protein